MKNSLKYQEDYSILYKVEMDGKEYWLAITEKKIGTMPSGTEFFVDAKTKNVIVDEALISKLMTCEAYLTDFAGLNILSDIEKTVQMTCEYIDEYTDIKGCGMIGSLAGKGAAAFAQTLATLKDPKNLHNCVDSFGGFFKESAGVDERIEIQIVLYFAEMSINNGLEALRIGSENYTSHTKTDYKTAVSVIEAYAKCKSYFQVVEALTKKTIDEYNQKTWYEKLLDGTQDAAEGLAEGVSGELFKSVKEFQKAEAAMNMVKNLKSMKEMEEKSEEILNCLKDGKACIQAADSVYSKTKAKYIDLDAKTIANNTRSLINGKSTVDWDALVGKTVASIKSGKSYTKWYGSKENILTKAGYDGECTWYAWGRFYEITGVKLTKARNAKNWLTDNKNNSKVTVVYGASKIVSGAIAVDTYGEYGHVMFVEHVIYDSKGNPTTVYFTECNWDTNSSYNAGKDCVVKKMSYKEFVSKRGPDGYIIAK